MDDERREELAARLAVRRMLRSDSATSAWAAAQVDERRQEVEVLLARHGAHHAEVLRARRALANVLAGMPARADEAIAAAETSFAAHEAALPDDDLALRDALECLGEVLAAAGRTDAAVAALRDLVGRDERGQPLVAADRLLKVAEVQRRAGRRADAAATLGEVGYRLDVYEGPSPTTCDVVRCRLAGHFRLLGDEQAMRRHLDRARASSEARRGAEGLAYLQEDIDIALGVDREDPDGATDDEPGAES